MRIDLQVKGQNEDIVAGIDLGTTNTLVAQIHNGSPRIIEDRNGRTVTPSVVSIDEEHHVNIGDEAIARSLLNPTGTVTSVKRFIGRALDDVSRELERQACQVVASEHGSQVAFRIHGREYLPQELSALILGEAKKRAERRLSARLKRAVITVPAYFDDAQRQATRDAGRMAGIDVLRIINEPTAAALAYGLDRKGSGTILVYDLGGGTFDVSILKLSEGLFKVIATTGNTALGGDDFDQVMADLMLRSCDEEQRQKISANPASKQLLKIAAEGAKKSLSSEANAQVELNFPELDLKLDTLIQRHDYEQAIMPLVRQTLDAVEFVLDDTDLDPEDIDEVVCVGGSTRTPLVRSELKRYFDREPHTDLNPDQVVAMGAAIQAQQLAGASNNQEGAVLLDVTPLSLGIETYGGGVTKLLWRNSPIPARASEGFTTQVDNQTAFDIHVLQGEREMARDLRSLARFKLRGIPPMAAGMPRLLVEFFIDANGILSVTARETTSGAEAKVEVTPTYGLTDEQVEDMILASIENAEEDVLAHLLADLRAESEGLIRYSRKALEERGEALPKPLVEEVTVAAKAMEKALQGNDKETIEAAMSVLNEATASIAQQMMNEVLKVTVAGRTVDEVMGSKPRKLASSLELK
ncbi:MAG: molecular chaperone DnaK [Rickettsiales bacterium]|nr:molecular chaperone DnaK [Rickettsiales bacterium]|tara:strand:+ start:3609 stop:5525 length:1917 start_codon:yes stop_codon:yes gene_type:complete